MRPQPSHGWPRSCGQRWDQQSRVEQQVGLQAICKNGVAKQLERQVTYRSRGCGGVGAH